MSVLFAVSPKHEAMPEWYFARDPLTVERVATAEIGSIKADRVVWLVPGTETLIAKIESSARTMADLRVASLYELEDEVSQQVNTLHIAIGEKRVDQPQYRDVAVISRPLMTGILAHLDDYPAEFISRVEFVPETSLFKANGMPFIYDGDGRLLLCDGENYADAVDPVIAADLLPALIHQSEISEAEVFSGAEPVLPGIQLPANFKSLAAEPMRFVEFVASPLIAGEGLNLRQAEFAPKRNMKIGVSGWTSSLILAAAACLIWLGVSFVSVMQLNAETDRLYDRMIAAYASAFPEESPVTDPRRAVAAKLGDLPGAQSGVSFIDLASVFYAGVREVEAVELDGFSYDKSSGRLTATLRFSSYQDRDQLKQFFDTQGIPITLGGARQEGGMLVGEAIIGEAIS